MYLLSGFNLMYKFFVILIAPVLFPFVLYSRSKFNNGICKKCKKTKIVLKDYNSDRFFQIYGCLNKSCGYKYRSVLQHTEISNSDLKISNRNIKLSKIK